MTNVMAAWGTPDFEEYSAGNIANWFRKYNAKSLLPPFLSSPCTLFF